MKRIAAIFVVVIALVGCGKDAAQVKLEETRRYAADQMRENAEARKKLAELRERQRQIGIGVSKTETNTHISDAEFEEIKAKHEKMKRNLSNN